MITVIFTGWHYIQLRKNRIEHHFKQYITLPTLQKCGWGRPGIPHSLHYRECFLLSLWYKVCQFSTKKIAGLVDSSHKAHRGDKGSACCIWAVGSSEKSKVLYCFFQWRTILFFLNCMTHFIFSNVILLIPPPFVKKGYCFKWNGYNNDKAKNINWNT